MSNMVCFSGLNVVKKGNNNDRYGLIYNDDIVYSY